MAASAQNASPWTSNEVMMSDDRKYQDRPGYTLIFRAYITLKNGRVLRASEVGKKAFPIWVKDSDSK